MSDYRIETKCIQSGYEPGNGEPRVLPIYQSTTFRYTSSEQMGRLFDLEESGYFYTRLQNPTNDAVAAKICDLEGGVSAMLTSSGQAANFSLRQETTLYVRLHFTAVHITSMRTRSGRWEWTLRLWTRTARKKNWKQHSRIIRKPYSANRSQTRRWSCLILKNLLKLPMHTGYRLSWTIRLPHRSTAVRLNGARILLRIPLQNIWTDMLHVWAELS